MASITIRNLDDELKDRLRLILRLAVSPSPMSSSSASGLGSRIRAHFADLGGVELDVLLRSSSPEPASLG